MAVGIGDLSGVWIDGKNSTDSLKYSLAGIESVGGACDTFSQQCVVRRLKCGRETG